MKDVKPIIKSASFPNAFASDSEKKTQEYGLTIGQAIQYEWFKGEGSNCRFYSQRREFHEKRLYALGKQSVGKYKNELAVDGDLSYLNLDWTPVPIIPKFVDIIVNGMSERVFSVKAYAQDAMSQSKKTKYQDMIEGQMVAKPMLETIAENTGANPFSVDPEQLPNTDEELSLYMQLNYKPAIEIAEETAINTVLDENDYQAIRKMVDYDITVIGVGMAKHEFQLGAGVVVNYVDPANVVYSYTEDPNFKDCFYWGEVKTVQVNELKKINPSLTNQDLVEISQYGRSWYNQYQRNDVYQNDMFSDDVCTLLYFNYKTTKTITYKKKLSEDGTVRFIEKDDTFNPPQEMMDEAGFERVSKTIDVWYEGVMVLGTTVILKWEMSKNMVRPKSASQHALSNYVACAPRMYHGVIDSTVGRMIPFADLIQMVHLKLQQVMSKMVPDGIFLDADGINEVDMGTGNAYTPDDALKLYFQTGSVVGRSYTQDGEFNNARIPITQLTASSGMGKAQMLIQSYNHYLDQIRTVTGLNEAVDATTPNPHALVGLQKLAALSSNTATRHILEGGLRIYKGLAEAVTYRIADILEYSDFAEEFINQVGKYNASILRDISDLYIYDFGVFIEISPDSEQKAELDNNINIALKQGNIDIEDAIDIKEIKNIKLANQLIKLKRKTKQDRQERLAMQQQAMAAQQGMQQQQMKSQSDMQTMQAELQGKMQLKQAEVAFDIERVRNEADLKLMLMRQEFEMNMQLKGLDLESLNQREDKKEDKKSERISQQNTQQSKLINQRKNNLPPLSFESNEDSLDGFDLAEFEPR
jgi:hypothetical protein